MHPEYDLRNKLKPSMAGRPAKLTRQRSMHKEGIVGELLSPMERQLFFKTAHAHLNSGCPSLAMQVLMELPATVTSERGSSAPEDPEPRIAKTSGNLTEDMINTGTISDFAFGGTHPNPATNGTVEAFDWSKPVSSQGGGNSVTDFDWSRPLASAFGKSTSNGFNSSKPVSTTLEGDELGNDIASVFDWSQPISTKLGGTGLDDVYGLHDNEPLSSEVSDLVGDGSKKEEPTALDHAKVQTESDSVGYKSKETRYLDVVAQQMKFSAILKLLLNELHGLPSSCEVADEELRPYFLKWLGKELEVLHRISDYGSVAEDIEDEGDDSVEINCIESRKTSRY